MWFTIELFSANSFLEKDIVVLGQVFSIDSFLYCVKSNLKFMEKFCFTVIINKAS